MKLSEKIYRTLRSGGLQAFETASGWTTWRQVAETCEQIETLLVGIGCGQHVPIGLIGRNLPRTASAMLAILAGERCVVPINPFQAEDRILDDIAGQSLAALIGEPEDLASGAIEALARGMNCAAISLEPSGAVRLVAGRTGSSSPGSGETALLIPTSGTTGAPKRVPIRFDSLAAANADAEAVAVEYGETLGPGELKSPLIQYSPLVHITGALSVSRCGSEGRRLVLLEKFSPQDWVEAVARHKIRVAGLPPAMMRMVLALEPPAEKLSSLIGVWSGSSPVDTAVVEQFESQYRCVVMGNYGATEYCGTVASGSLADRRRFGDAKDGAVGRIRRHVADFQILDPESGQEAPIGECGILQVRVHRMGHDWMQTSDLVSIDADDFLYVHGRVDDAINRGGFKILPSVISDALKRHPDIDDVAVVGLPDARLGETPVAAVELKPDRPVLTSEDLMRFARQELIAYQVPTQIRIVAALPRTGSMKIDKLGVRALF